MQTVDKTLERTFVNEVKAVSYTHLDVYKRQQYRELRMVESQQEKV